MVVVGGDLDREGYLHLRDVIDPSLVTPELIEHISSTPPNPADGYSGILRPQHTPATVEIERQTIEAILKAHPGLDAVTQPRTQDPVQLVPGRPLIAIKVGPNADKKKTGGLNWHVDAYSYFLRGDHHQWYVAYTPILKENERDSNLAVIPYSVLQKVDPRAYEKLKGRGAVDFIKMQKGWPKGLEIAQRLAPGGLPDGRLDRDRQGRRRLLDLQAGVQPRAHGRPQLRNLDVLVFRADLIHRTADRVQPDLDQVGPRPEHRPRLLRLSTAGTEEVVQGGCWFACAASRTRGARARPAHGAACDDPTG